MNMKTRPSLREVEISEAVTVLSQHEDRGVREFVAFTEGGKQERNTLRGESMCYEYEDKAILT